MEVTPSCWASAGLLSTSTLAIWTEPAISPASWSRTGPSCLQGPHQVAQKSTSTGTLAALIDESKFVVSRLEISSDAMGEALNPSS